MSRYIDAEALISDIEECSYDTWSKGVNRTWWAQAVRIKDNIKECIKRQPTADVEEVVRCKDCIYHRTPDCSLWYGTLGDTDYIRDMGDNFYCSCGERDVDDGT